MNAPPPSFADVPRPVLGTERLLLDQPARSDTPAILALASDFEVSRWLARVPHPYGEADAGVLFDTVVHASLVFAIRRRADDAFMGLVSLHPGDDAELGYWLGRPYWGAGYATEAAAAVLAHGFAVLGLPRVDSGVFEGNERSVRVLAKLGFRETGRSRKWCLALGRDLPHIDLACERPGA